MLEKKAVFAVPGDLNALTGGYIYEKHVYEGLMRDGWDITLLSLPEGFPDPSAETIEAVVRAFDTLREETPVLLDGFLPGAMPPEAFAHLRAPFVAITHHPQGYETGLDPARAAQLCAIERANLARARHVIVPSPHTAEVLQDDFAVPQRRITVAAPGVHRPDTLTDARAEPPVILCVGQLVPRKGQDVLLDALASLSSLDWQARLVGRGVDPTYVDALHRQARRLGLSDRVTFVGEASADALSAEYAQATVFALPTRYEGYGMVFAEALVHGLPIVSCSAGAVPQTVPADAGILAPTDDATAIASALETVLTDGERRRALAAAAALHGRALPSWDDTALQVGAVLTAVRG
ncbi:MAG: glycosyltransferase family 4 protein [Pseudomonadota bacterium]